MLLIGPFVVLRKRLALLDTMLFEPLEEVWAFSSSASLLTTVPTAFEALSGLRRRLGTSTVGRRAPRRSASDWATGGVNSMAQGRQWFFDLSQGGCVDIRYSVHLALMLAAQSLDEVLLLDIG